MGDNAPGRLAVAAFCVLLFGQGIASSATAEEGRVTSHFIEISDTFTIHYETAGRGDITIVFIPGWTMTTRAFQHQLAHFAGSDDFTALTYDPRGQGLSTKTTEGHYYEQHGRDLHALIEALGLDRIVLAGWSYGTLDELAYVDQFGAGKLVGLIMIDGTPKSKGTDFTKEWVWWGTKDEGDQDDFFKYFSYDLPSSIPGPCTGCSPSYAIARAEQAPAITRPLSTAESPAQCCRICRKGQPCGDACISSTKQCRKEQGCACSAASDS